MSRQIVKYLFLLFMPTGISGKDLKTAIRGKYLNMSDVADLLNVSRQTLSAWLNKAEVSDYTLRIVKERLGITLHVDGTDEAQNSTDGKKQDLSNTSFQQIPMYDFPAAASEIEMYNDSRNFKPTNYMYIPGAGKDSFALPILGESMIPTLKPGAWAVVRPINDVQDIIWGEVYYIEYGDYRLYKRLLKAEEDDSVILWSDNQHEKLLERPKYAEIKIKKTRITKLCILTNILEKPSY